MPDENAERIYRDYLETHLVKDCDKLASAIRECADECEKIAHWDDFAAIAYDGHDIPLLFDILSLVEDDMKDSFRWNYLIAMALYRSAVVINTADDVLFNENCTNARETLRSARAYSKKAQEIERDSDLERLDSVISRALTVLRLKGQRDEAAL